MNRSNGKSDGEGAFRFDLFVCHVRKDDGWLAKHLNGSLERIHELLPAESEIASQQAARRLRPLSVFVDTLGTTRRLKGDSESREREVAGDGGLDPTLRRHLEESRALLVLCNEGFEDSKSASLELEWWIRNRGTQNLLLAATGGNDPWGADSTYFPPVIRELKLERPAGFDFSRARRWRWSGASQDSLTTETVRLAATLMPCEAREILPYYLLEERRRISRRNRLLTIGGLSVVIALFIAVMFGLQSRADRRRATQESGWRDVAEAYRHLYSKPDRAVFKAVSAANKLDRWESDQVLRDSYRVAILRNENRKEAEALDGRGPAYIAPRYRMGRVFSTFSDDGRYTLVVTERGPSGATPPGDVYRLDNESLGIVKLPGAKRRLENAMFDRSTREVLVPRQYEVHRFDASGSLIRKHSFGKFPLSGAYGYLDDRFMVVCGANGELWSLDIESNEQRPLRSRSGGQAVMRVDMSADGRRALLVAYAHDDAPMPGRVDLLEVSADGLKQTTVLETGAAFAGFDPSNSERYLVAGFGVRPVLRVVGPSDETPLDHPNTSVEWAAFAADGRRCLTIDVDRVIRVLDTDTGAIVRTLNFPDEVDDALSARREHFAAVRAAEASAKRSEPERPREAQFNPDSGWRTLVDLVEKEHEHAQRAADRLVEIEIPDNAVRRLVGALANGSPRTQERVAAILAAKGRQSSLAAPMLADMLRAPQDEVVRASVRALRSLAGHAEPALHRLWELRTGRTDRVADKAEYLIEEIRRVAGPSAYHLGQQDLLSMLGRGEGDPVAVVRALHTASGDLEALHMALLSRIVQGHDPEGIVLCLVARCKADGKSTDRVLAHAVTGFSQGKVSVGTIRTVLQRCTAAAAAPVLGTLVPALKRLSERKERPFTQETIQAGLALVACVSFSGDIRGYLLRRLGRGPKQVRIQSIEALVAVKNPAPDTQLYLLSQARTRDEQVRWAAIRAMHRLSKRADGKALLLAGLEHRDVELRESMISLLAMMSVAKGRLDNALRKKTMREVTQVRDPFQRAVGLAWLRAQSKPSKAQQEWGKRLLDDAPAVSLLADIAAQLESFGDALWSRLDDENRSVRSRAGQALGHPLWGRTRIGELLERCKNRDPEHRARAVKILGRLGPDVKDGWRVAHRMLQDPNRNVRVAAVTALGRMGAIASEALADLDELSKGREPLKDNARKAASRIRQALGR